MGILLLAQDRDLLLGLLPIGRGRSIFGGHGYFVMHLGLGSIISFHSFGSRWAGTRRDRAGHV